MTGRPKRYLPAEDTYLLRDAVLNIVGERKGSGGTCLEIGFGSGSVIASVAHAYTLSVGTDIIDMEDARLARAPGIDLVLADRATCFRDGVFDVVIFNPPYLPSSSIDDATVDGGKNGIEIAVAFLSEALRVLRPCGRVFVLLSAESDIKAFLSRGVGDRLSVERIAEKTLFYEELVVFKITRRRSAAEETGQATPVTNR